MSDQHSTYYVPEQSRLPFWASIGVVGMLAGLGSVINDHSMNLQQTWPWLFALVGTAIILSVVFYWFRQVITESHAQLYSPQMDTSFRLGMAWFIFSEVMFFAAFFGALFYTRTFAIPWLGGEGAKGPVNELLWTEFIPAWPLFNNPNEYLFPGPDAIINPWHLPLLNTILLVTSSFTLTWAHHCLKAGQRGLLKFWMIVTIALGVTFLYFQVAEYIEAYKELGLTLASGIYGSTFFMLTGFHGAHVTLGTLMLIIMTLRIFKGHFTGDKHFAFEATAWYWHFVDVVWLGLFIFVYLL